MDDDLQQDLQFSAAHRCDFLYHAVVFHCSYRLLHSGPVFITLRIVSISVTSLAAAYCLWTLSRWLYTAKPVKAPFHIGLLAVSALLCLCFLVLGTAAPDKVVITVWRAIGKGIALIAMFS